MSLCCNVILKTLKFKFSLNAIKTIKRKTPPGFDSCPLAESCSTSNDWKSALSIITHTVDWSENTIHLKKWDHHIFKIIKQLLCLKKSDWLGLRQKLMHFFLSSGTFPNHHYLKEKFEHGADVCFQVDSSLSFLDGFVSEALAAGAAPYKPPHQRQEELAQAKGTRCENTQHCDGSVCFGLTWLSCAPQRWAWSHTASRCPSACRPAASPTDNLPHCCPWALGCQAIALSFHTKEGM